MKIAIASGKGGTGKTTLSVNLAAMMSHTHPEAETVLTDLDVEEPNSGLFLEGETVEEQHSYRQVPGWIPEKCTFCNVCRDVCKFNAIAVLPNQVLVFNELCHSCHACVGLCPEDALEMKDHHMGELKHIRTGGLSFVEGELKIGEQMAVPMIERTLDYTQKHFNNTALKIYDAPPGTSCPVIESVKDADYVVLVTEPTPFGLHDLKLSVETMRKVGKQFGVVINRDGIGNDDTENYCREEGIDIIGRIPNMREIAGKYSRGETIWEIPEVKEQMTGILENISRITGKPVFPGQKEEG
jgi:MinD superfamily P-loop ATPase